MIDPAVLDRLVAAVSHVYERPHAVVEAEQRFLDDLRASGADPVVERTPGKPSARRYVVDDYVVEGTVDVAGTRIHLRVTPLHSRP